MRHDGVIYEPSLPLPLDDGSAQNRRSVVLGYCWAVGWNEWSEPADVLERLSFCTPIYGNELLHRVSDKTHNAILGPSSNV